MDAIKWKKIIAREWLIFLTALFIGIIFSVLLFFLDSTTKSEETIRIGNWWKNDPIVFDEKISTSELQKFRQKYPQYNDLDDSTLINKLKAKYAKREFDPSTAKPFVEVKQEYNPTFFSGLSKLFIQLFSRRYWFNTLFSILIPYLLFQMFRSIYFSLRILFINNKTSLK